MLLEKEHKNNVSIKIFFKCFTSSLNGTRSRSTDERLIDIQWLTGVYLEFVSRHVWLVLKYIVYE